MGVMFGLFKGFLKIRYALIILAITGAWQIWLMTCPEHPELDIPRKNIAEDACWKIADDIPPLSTEADAAVLRFSGDETGYITQRLREILKRTGKVNLIDDSFFRRLLREMEIEEKEIHTFDEALEFGRKSGVQYVLFGTLVKFISNRMDAEIKIDYRLLDMQTGRAVLSNTIEEKPRRVQWRILSVSATSRFIGWVLFALLFPIVLIPITRRIIAKESNAANLIMLLIYICITFICALFLMAFQADSLWKVALLILALVSTGIYNYWVANTVERLAK